MGLAEINTAVGQMDKVVQQNAAMVEESTAAAHCLLDDARNLTEMVRRFTITGDARPVPQWATVPYGLWQADQS